MIWFLGAAGLGVTPLGAQRTPSAADSARIASDSLAARLRRAEQAIAVLQQQVADQASAGVSTRSRMQLELNGSVLMHAFRNDGRVNNADDPQFALISATAPGTPVALTVRQTRLGAVLTASDVLGGHFVGDVDVDFFGGQQPSSGGRTFPLLRLRTARSTVKWTHGELLVGQEMPLVSGLNPVSPAAIGTPAFAAAGNLWLWLPQVRATIQSAGDISLGIQGAMLANINGDAVGLFDTDVDPAERSGRPAFESRVRARFGGEDMPSEIGCGAHVGWLTTPSNPSARTHAFACDAKLTLGPRADLQGEAFTGRGLRGLGGGGIGQNVGASLAPLDDKGGWAQLNVDLSTTARGGAGCGTDMPRELDVPAGGRLRNQACAGYAMVRPSGPLVFGAEIRRISTKYAAGSATNYHINFSAGFEF
ncbi:MAG: hypothetical protein V4550_02035 [Gemmatimonadota bacterium]